MKAHTLTRAAAAAAASLAVVVPLAGCTGGDSGNGSQSPPSRQSAPPSAGSSPAGTSPASGGAEYRNGAYTVRGVYGGAPSYLTVAVTLRADRITKVTVTPMPDNNDTSRGYQERFAAAVPDAVVGKSIDDLEVGKLAGASGCADGFNNALSKIRKQAATSNQQRESS